MAEFKFYLNGMEVEEPMNWMDSKFEYRRDPDLPGLITTFVADVEFYGSGYDLIKQEFENGSGCGEVLVKIEELCTNGINREGIIFLSEIDLDLYRCVAKCNIEDNTIYGKLSRLKETKVQINCEKTVNGQVLSQISDFPMPFRTVGSTANPAMAGALSPAFANMFRAFRVAEVMQQILNYITDNGATIISDFLGIGPGINVGTTAKIYTEKICGMILGWTGNLSVPMGDTLLTSDGADPILILDDIFAELDNQRRQQLTAVTQLAEQTIITTAVESDLPPELLSAKFYVSPGKVSSVNG